MPRAASYQSHSEGEGRLAETSRILVIKLGALGDFVQCFGLYRAIRDHHAGAEVVLLTTPRYAPLAEASGLFDGVWIDRRPPFWRLDRLWPLIARLRRARFDRVYDLQRSDRSGWYFRLLGSARPQWVGIVPGASHRYRDPPTPTHIMDRHREMLAHAGIRDVPAPDLSFLAADLGRFDLPRDYALLIPGSSAGGLHKRWPKDRYVALAAALGARALAPVIVAGPAERDLAREIAAAAAEARAVETDLAETAVLARGARLAVGNDTGPTHLVAAAGCPLVALYGAGRSTAQNTPRGASVTVLERRDVKDITLEDVVAEVDGLLGAGSG